MTVGETIRKVRKEKGMTQKQLGDACIPPIAESNIRKYELDKQNPKLETLLRISKALNIPSYVLTKCLDDGVQLLISDLEREKKTFLNIGSNIKKCRVQHNLSIEQLSTTLQIPCDLLEKYESGTTYIPLSILNDISTVLGVKNIDLVGNDNKYLLLSMSYEQKEHFNDIREDSITIDGTLISDNTLLEYFHKLNNSGKKAAIDRVSELRFIPGYTGEDDSPF